MIITQSPHVDAPQIVAYNLIWLGGNGSPRRLDPSEVAWIRAGVEYVASLVSSLKVASDEDRNIFVRLAALSLDTAEAFRQAIDSQPRSPEEKQEIEEILYRIEDIAETATLAADADFNQFIDSEIQRYLHEQDSAR